MVQALFEVVSFLYLTYGKIVVALLSVMAAAEVMFFTALTMVIFGWADPMTRLWLFGLSAGLFLFSSYFEIVIFLRRRYRF